MNGRAIKASDAKYTYERLLKMAPYAGLYSPIDSITAPDDQTLTIKVKSPYAPPTNYLAHYYALVIAPEVVEQNRDLKTQEAAMELGSGPFELSDFKAGQSMSFKRRANYWRDVYLDGIERRNTVDTNAATRSIRTRSLQPAVPVHSTSSA